MSGPAVADFVRRMQAERVERGLPAAIIDANALRLIAALAARRGGGDNGRATA
jgi:hypothetical protein